MARILTKSMVVLVLALGLAFLAGCENAAQTGALIGAGVGAGTGQLIGRDTESTLIGTAVGGGIGYIIGNEQDKKNAAFERQAIRQEAQAQAQTEVVWVTTSNGSKIPVKLRRQGPYWVGPEGEYYDTMPTNEQLNKLYGF
jgi:hypothetical protein